MPYRSAPYYVAFVIAVILTGFWPTYWSVLSTSRWQFHFHGAVSSCWVLMVLFQSVMVRKDQLALHRATGMASLFLFPLLIGGLMGIIDVTAKKYVEGDMAANPVTMMFGPSFLAGLTPALVAYLVLYYQALKHRRKVWAHAGYMLGTPIILFESPFSRALDMTGLPGIAIRGPEDFPDLLNAIHVGNAVAFAFCLAVYWRVGPRARPFLVTAAFVAAQSVLMATLNEVGWVRSALLAIGQLPSAVMIALGIAMGAAASWFGWQAGKPERKAAAIPQVGLSA